MAVAAAVTTDPMTPVPFRVRGVRKDLPDTYSMDLEPADGEGPLRFAPGQFNMLYHFGVGEVPISISGDPAVTDRLTHTIRAVGAVSRGMGTLKAGDMVGVRGPFGSAWPVEEARGSDVVIICGGIGLAPLRPAIYSILAERPSYGRFVILYGARSPRDILFRRELERWGGRLDTYVDATVDRATGEWSGNVGVVTNLIRHAGFDPVDSVAMVCGPETMMQYTVEALRDRGLDDTRIYLSMERNMKCAVGFCGRCQLGGSFVCRDGPVFRFDRIAPIFRVREL